MNESPISARPAWAAGRFYTDDPPALFAEVESYLDESAAPKVQPKALVVPHAGYPYSGAVAGKAYGLLPAFRDRIRRVVLLGPSHRVPLYGVCLPEAQAFDTPLGRVGLESTARESLMGLAGIEVSDRPHATEHSLEVQLPFLQVALGPGFRLIPLLSGHGDASDVEEALIRLWGGSETLIVCSTDLSHYLPYAQARRLDEATAGLIEQYRTAELGDDSACGSHPLRGFLRASKRMQLKPRRLMLCNSGDTAGEKNEVVGYGAWAFES